MSLFSRRGVLCLGFMALLSAGTTLNAAGPDRNTVVTVGEMCGGCVKKITARLEKVADIEKIECDIKTKTVTIVPKADKSLSPRFVWDTMAEIGKTPKKLVGPTGTFTSKPEE